MAEPIPKEVQRWRTMVENSVLTSYYRVLSFVSLRAPIGEVYETCLWLSENTDLAGEVYYLIPDRLFNWEDVVVNRSPDYPITMTVRVFGSAVRNRNTVFARAGWFFMYTTGPIIDTVLARIGDAWENWVGWR